MAWWKTAKVGDKVVCIKLPIYCHDIRTGKPVSSGSGPRLDEGRVYEIAKLNSTDLGVSDVALRLVGDVAWYDADLFRPVQTKSSETGVAALKRHLVGVPVTEGVE